jgi:hypothetical protein
MSEEHVRRWSQQRHVPVGRILPVATLWRVARQWYVGRLDDAWRQPAVPERQAMLEAAGLVGPFWTLPLS